MQKTLPFLLFAIVLANVLFSRCAQDLLPPGSTPGKEDAEAVRLAFEHTATDLQEVDFSYTRTGARTKSSNQSIIVPRWNQMTAKEDGSMTTYEVPLSGNLRQQAVITKQKQGRWLTPVVSNINTHLVIKYNKELNDYFYFIVTMLGSNANPDERPLRYVGNKSFNGYIYVSDLDGRCLQLLKSFGGVRQLLRTNFKTDTSPNQGEVGVEALSIKMYRNLTPGYCVGEASGGGHVHKENDKGEDCIKNCPKRVLDEACPCDACTMHIPDAEIKPDEKHCPKCLAPIKNCLCCRLCREFPCQCYGCSYCGSSFCSGECRNVCYYCGSWSCNGSCIDHGGGGSGTGSEPDHPCPHDKCICGKYVRSFLRANVCNDKHDYCLTNGNCKLEIRLSIPEAVTLGDVYKVSLSILSPVVVPNIIEYKIWRNGVIGNDFMIPYENVKDFTLRATMPGTWNIAVAMNYGNNNEAADTVQIKHNFPTADQIKNDPDVIQAMKDAWVSTKALATPTTCAEVGFYIYLKTYPDRYKYDCSKIVTGSIVSYNQRASVDLGVPDDDTPRPADFNPLGEGSFWVASFHTHPTLSNNSDKTFKWPVGPSKNDKAPAKGTPAFLSDYVGDKDKQHNATDSINSLRTIYRFGGTQRNNPF